MTQPELEAYVARRQEALDRVRAVMVETLHLRGKPDELDPDAPLFGTGLGLDSVDGVELIIALETEFGIALPNDARPHLRTVNKVVDLVTAAREAKGVA